jgi:hypothetical protein
MAPTEPPAPDSDLYALADDAAAAKPGMTVPAKAGEGAVARPAPLKVQPLAYREESTTAGANSEVSRWFPDRVRDLYLPLGLLAGGTVVEIIATLVFNGARATTLVSMLRSMSVSLVLSTGIMLVAILLAGKLRHIDYGRLPVAILKLSAVVVGTIGITLTLGVIFMMVPIFGWFLFLALPFVCYYTLLGALFDLDASDCTYTCFVMIIVWIVYTFAISPMLA